MNFENLEELTPEAAKVLSAGNIKLSLPWKALQEHPRAFRALLQSEKGLFFSNVGRLSEKMAEELLFPEETLTPEQALQTIFLDGITEIPMKTAEFLVSSKKPISISIQGFISDFVLKLIAKNPKIKIIFPSDYSYYLKEARANSEEATEEKEKFS